MMPQNGGAPQHLMPQNSAAPPQHVVQQSSNAPPQHVVQQNGGAPPQHVMQQQGTAPQHVMQQNGGTHVIQQTSAAPQHVTQQHIIQQRTIPAPHQAVQGVGGHTHGNLPSSNHVIMSQYGHHPPTSLPGVIVSVPSPHPAPGQHILHPMNNGTNLSHLGQVEGAGYHRHPGVQAQYGRPPPVLLNQGGAADSSVNTKEKTPMCLVNELARFNKIQHQYKLTDECGPAHKKNFTVCLKIGDKEEFVASGPSIKKAQHAAAAIALEKTEFKHPAPKPKNTKSTNVTPTVELNALAMKRGEVTNYTFIQPNRSNQYSLSIRNRSAGFPPIFAVQLKVGACEFIGEGATAQAARHCAASQALKMMKEGPGGDGKSKLDPTSNPFIPGAEYDELKSPISLVHEVALKRNLSVAFSVVRETGPPHMRMFITRCTVGEFISEGEGNGKKVSKKRAAELMLNKLRELPPVASAVHTKHRKQTNTKKKSKNLIKVENKEAADPKQAINPISRLIQIQQAKKEKEPVYTLIGERGMPRRREFFIKVEVGSLNAVGSGPNKKVAKRAAAEALLQLTGYSRPSAVPTKPALKVPGEASDKSKKLTFVDEVKGEEGNTTSGSASRQLVPGLLYIDDKTAKINGKVNAGHNIYEKKKPSQSQAATIAKELLDGGTSPTADQLAKEAGSNMPAPLPHLPTSGQGVSSKEQLAYLSQILGFTVTYDDFPKKGEGEYLTLVSLSTNPPQVSHGFGQTLESSHNNAAHTALKTLAATGLDTIDQENGRA